MIPAREITQEDQQKATSGLAFALSQLSKKSREKASVSRVNLEAETERNGFNVNPLSLDGCKAYQIQCEAFGKEVRDFNAFQNSEEIVMFCLKGSAVIYRLDSDEKTLQKFDSVRINPNQISNIQALEECNLLWISDDQE